MNKAKIVRRAVSLTTALVMLAILTMPIIISASNSSIYNHFTAEDLEKVVIWDWRTWSFSHYSVHYRMEHNRHYVRTIYDYNDLPVYISISYPWINYLFDRPYYENRLNREVETIESDFWGEAQYSTVKTNEPPPPMPANGPPPPPDPADPWWDANYDYRKSFDVTGQATTESNYQIRIDVHRDSGSDSGTDVYVSTKCEEDYDDIRFTNDEASPDVLDYWIETSDSSDALIWVELDSITGSGTDTFYMYYGYASAAAYSDGEDTFPTEFQDFDTDDAFYTGASVNIDEGGDERVEWTSSASYGDGEELTPASTGGELAIEFYCEFSGFGSFGAMRVMYGDTLQSAWGLGAGWDAVGTQLAYGGRFTSYAVENGVGDTSGGVGDLSLSTTYWVRVTFDNGNVNATAFTDHWDTVQATYEVAGVSLTDNPDTLTYQNRDRAGTVGWVDDVRIRHWVEEDPGADSWGSEETAPATPAIDDSSSKLTNDDIGYICAKMREYIFTFNVSDADGFSSIDYANMTLTTDDGGGGTGTVRWAVSFDEDTGVFTEHDPNGYIALGGSSSNVSSGNCVNMTIYITFDWDHPDDDDVDMEYYVIDATSLSDEDFDDTADESGEIDIRTQIDIANLAVTDGSGTVDRGTAGGSITITGNAKYYDTGMTGIYPNSGSLDVVDVWTDALNDGDSSDLELGASGAFSISATADDDVGLDNYNVIVVNQGDGEGGTDLCHETHSDTYISDKLNTTITIGDSRININDNASIQVSAVYVYDGDPFDGSLTLNDTTYDYGVVGKYGYTVSSASGDSHGVTTFDVNDEDYVIFDSLTITITIGDSRIGINVNASIQVSAVYDYDSGSYDGTLTLNDTTYEYATVGKRGYTLSSAGGDDSYGITAIGTNDEGYVIWDSVTLTITIGDHRIDINVNCSLQVSGVYDYDSAAYDGTITLNYTTYTHAAACNKTYTVSSLGGDDTYGISVIGTNDIEYVIWDSLTITITIGDNRIGIGVNASIQISATYDLDNAAYDGTLNLNDTTYNYSTVGKRGYTCSSADGDDTYGITAIGTNDEEYVIWDSVAFTIVIGDNRINISANASIQVSGTYDYDAGAYDGTITLNDTTYDHSTVGIYYYNVSSITGDTYGIYNVSSCTAQYVIFDRVQVSGYSVSDSRDDINDSVTIDVTLIYDYDNTQVTDGTVTINGNATVHQGGGVWRATDSSASVQQRTYNSVAVSGNTHGITAVDDNGQSDTVIWDKMVVISYTAGDSRDNINDNVNMDVEIRYSYDNALVADGTITINGNASAYQGAPLFVWRVTQTSATVQMRTYNSVVAGGDDTYGITEVDQNGQSGTIIWDQIEVFWSGNDDATPYQGSWWRGSVNTYAEVRFALRYEYDSANVTTGGMYLNGTSDSLVWVAGSYWWAVSKTSATVKEEWYYVVWSAGDTYGITAFDNSSATTYMQDPIWDRIEIYNSGDNTSDQRININDSAEIRFYARYEFDGQEFNDTVGDLWLGLQDAQSPYGVFNNKSMAWDDANTWWDISESNSTVVGITYYVHSTYEYTLGIGENNTGTLSYNITMIWDRIELFWSLGSLGSVSLGDTIEVRFMIRYEYDLANVTTGNAHTNSTSLNSLLYAGSAYWWNASFTADTIGDHSWIFVWDGGDTYGITAFDNSTEATYKCYAANSGVDRVVLWWSGADDTRVSINTNAEIRFKFKWESDDVAITGTDASFWFSVSGCVNVSLSWDAGNSWWEATVTNASVLQREFYVYDHIDYTRSITADTGYLSYNQSIIWDSITVTITIGDNRIDINVNASIQVTAVYDWDGNPYDGTLTLNDTTYQYATVGKRGYTLASAGGDDTYGITAIGTNDEEYVIWDRVQVSGYSVSDGRVDISTNVNIDVTLIYDFDNTQVTDGTVTINGNSTTHQGSGVWRAVDNHATVGLRTYNTVACSGNTHGITVVDQNSKSDTVIWDSLTITITIGDHRIDINVNASINVSAVYDHDSATYDGTLTLNNTTYQYATAQRQDYTVASAAGDDTYGITVISTNDIDYVIWDSLTVTITIGDSRIDAGSNASISVSGVYDYDGAAYDGTFTLNDTTYNHAVVDIYYYTATVGNGDDTYGITVISTNDVDYVIFDSISGTVTFADHRRNIATTATPLTSATYDYDGASYDGTYTYNDTNFAHITAGKYGYNVTAGNGDDTYGITVVSSFTADYVIFDSVTITITGPTDSRISIGENATISATLVYDYDGATYDGFHTWNDTDFAHSDVGAYGYNITVIAGDTYGITAISSITPVTVIFDRVEVYWSGVNDTSPVFDEYVEIRFKLRYEYDNAEVTTGSASVYVGYETLTWDAVNTWWDDTVYSATNQTKTYYVIWNGGDTYGINAFDNSSAITYIITVIWGNNYPLLIVADTYFVGLTNSSTLEVGFIYQLQFVCYDLDGYDEIDFAYVALYPDDENSHDWEDCVWAVAYFGGTTFSIYEGTWHCGPEYISLLETSFVYGSGDYLYITFNIYFRETHPLMEDIDLLLFVEDRFGANNSEWQDNAGYYNGDVFELDVTLNNSTEPPEPPGPEPPPVVGELLPVLVAAAILVIIVLIVFFVKTRDRKEKPKKKKAEAVYWLD